jgi:hypothetical protein
MKEYLELLLEDVKERVINSKLETVSKLQGEATAYRRVITMFESAQEDS